MAITLNPNDPAIVRGIKTVGVGKKGSQPLTLELAHEILEDIKANKVSPAASGAFFAGLLAKGISEDEQVLAKAFEAGVFKEPALMMHALCADAPDFIRWVCLQLVEGKQLDRSTAYDMGRFLFSDEAGDGARGFIASYLRVRYETDDEYAGLLQALEETIDRAKVPTLLAGGPIIQIAEPFDGVDHSYMLTPLLGQFLTKKGYRVVHVVGDNSGPKWDMNLKDVFSHLDDTNAFGHVLDENNISPSFNRWNIIRRQTIKRPFLSTLERFINPYQADMLIASAFHPPYGEKMIKIAENAGFKKIIIVRNGIEGSVAFALMRPVKVLVSCQQPDGTYVRQERVIENQDMVDMEEKIEHPKATDNANLIRLYQSQGKSGNDLFDRRVQFTCTGLGEVVDLCFGQK